MYQPGNLGFNSWFQQEMCLFPKMSKLSLRATQQTTYQTFFPLWGGGVSGRGLKLTTHPCQMLNSKGLTDVRLSQQLCWGLPSSWTAWPWRKRNHVALPSANNHHPMTQHHRTKDFSPHPMVWAPKCTDILQRKIGFRAKNFPSEFNLLKSGGY
jgi:hypothetical protein